MKKREKWDLSRPDTKAKRDEIVHGTFVKEGTMVAFPTCFPGVTKPIPANESYITALETSNDGSIYGGTSGEKVHCFVGMFHGVTGMVFDLGVVEGANECKSICCTDQSFYAGVNGSSGGRLISGELQPLPFDLIQEWWFTRKPLHDLGEAAQEEAILGVAAADGEVMGATEGHIFRLESGDCIELISRLEGTCSSISVGPLGRLYGVSDGHIWRYDPRENNLEQQVGCLNNLDLGNGVSWASDHQRIIMYIGDSSGRLYRLDPRTDSLEILGSTLLGPAGPMSVTLDGRVFGFCGKGISKLFSFDPNDGLVRDLGAAVSVIERRRYGYEFGAATMGRDGEVVFGENDTLGHLWLYYPGLRREVDRRS